MIEKKKPGANLEKNRTTLLSAGLILVSSLVLVAFEWKTLTVENKYGATLEDEEVHMIEEDLITELPEYVKPKVIPPRPQQQTPTDNVIIDNNVVNIDIDVTTDPDPDFEPVDFDFPIEGGDGPVDDVLNKEFRIVEEMPEFPGGEAALFKFIGENTVYPADAREFNYQGTSYVEFTIETDGSITGVKAIRPLDFGLNEEAMRVIKLMPKWKPGEQRGRKVRVRYTIPIRFALQKN